MKTVDVVTQNRIDILEKKVIELQKKLEYFANELGRAHLKLVAMDDRHRLREEQRMRGIRP